MKALFVTGEAIPFVNTGMVTGLLQELPKELSKQEDMQLCIVMPYYKAVAEQPTFQIKYITNFGVQLGWRHLHCGLFHAVDTESGINYYFLDNKYYFYRDEIYGHQDDGERFAFFAKAAITALEYIDFVPDVINCTDWTSALVPLFLKSDFSHLEPYRDIKTLLTVNDVEYQGKASGEFLTEVLGLSENWRSIITQGDNINFVKTAVVLADGVVTKEGIKALPGLESVSTTYAYKFASIAEKNAVDFAKHYREIFEHLLFEDEMTADL
ncbi:MAG: glycogen/starch synthase [Oscillospiraceae bacterium]